MKTNYDAVVNFKRKYQGLNHICESRVEAVAFYKQLSKEHPRIEFRVWNGVTGFGNYRDDITDQVKQEIQL